MKAGRMRDRITLYRPVTEVSATGASRASYQEVRTVWAELPSYNGYSRDEVGEHFADYSAQFNINMAHPVREQWRVKHLQTGYLYTVDNILVNRGRGFVTLKCSRVNE